MSDWSCLGYVDGLELGVEAIHHGKNETVSWASPDFPDTFGSPIMGSEVKHGVTTAVQSRVQD